MVGGHGAVGIEAGAHDVDAVEAGFGGDFLRISPERQILVCHHDVEVSPRARTAQDPGELRP